MQQHVAKKPRKESREPRYYDFLFLSLWRALREEEEDRLNSSLGGVERGDDASVFLVKESILEKEHWGMPTFSLSSLVMSGEVVLAFFGE